MKIFEDGFIFILEFNRQYTPFKYEKNVSWFSYSTDVRRKTDFTFCAICAKYIRNEKVNIYHDCFLFLWISIICEEKSLVCWISFIPRWNMISYTNALLFTLLLKYLPDTRDLLIRYEAQQIPTEWININISNIVWDRIFDTGLHFVAKWLGSPLRV